MISRVAIELRAAYACAVLRIADTLMISLSNIPLIQLLEFNVCRKYYREHDPGFIPDTAGNVPEALCKDFNIQSIISYLTGTASVLMLVPAILATLPYLSVKAMSGRRRTFIVNVLGSLLMNSYYAIILKYDHVFDPRWMWLMGFFSFIGGGDLVFNSLSQAVIAESLTPNQLSSFYLYTSAAALLAKFLGSASALAVMNVSLLLPIVLGLGIKSASILIIRLFIPGPNKQDRNISPESFQLLAEYNDDSANNEHGDHNITSLDTPIPKTSSIHRHAIALWRNRQPLAVYALQDFGNSFRYILPYWLSRRYGWTLKGTGWIFNVEMLFASLIMALLPRCFKLIHRGNTQKRDLDLARMCLAFSAAGTFLLGITWHTIPAVICVAVIAGGTPFRDAYMGHLTSKLQKQQITEMYIYLSVVQLTAFSVGAWIVAGLDAICLRSNNVWWTSLPIWLCSMAFGSAALLAG